MWFLSKSTSFVVNLALTFDSVERKDITGFVVYTLNEGTANYVVTDNVDSFVENITYNFVLSDNNVPPKTYWLSNIKLNIIADIISGTGTATVNGRFYDHDYGYVDASTEGSLVVPDIATPTGILWFNGMSSKGYRLRSTK